MGFFDLPHLTDTATGVQEAADRLRGRFDNLVVLGMGGSALGGRALLEALLGPLWNERKPEERDHHPRVFVLDNIDPVTLSHLFDRIDLRGTLFNVVSKSGATAETMARYLVVFERLSAEVGEENARGHFLFTTDPREGALRRISEGTGIRSLAIPENVGGRFSVLSAVGLLPAAITGIAIREILAGAAQMELRCRSPNLAENPAGILATLLHTAHVELGARVHVLMPYSDRLWPFALWFRQLWAESLGKSVEPEGADRGPAAPTPLAAVGASDQHSLLQLLMEGPPDKAVLFVGVGDDRYPMPIPSRYAEISGLSYLGGHSLAGLLDIERAATTEALRRRGRPNMTVELELLSPACMGALLMFFQIATVFAGALYGVDPLVQPGVEFGKRLTYGLLGREGFEPPSIDPVDPRWRVETG